jgi:hypothetical protein
MFYLATLPIARTTQHQWWRNKCENGELLEWQWKGHNDVLAEEPVSVHVAHQTPQNGLRIESETPSSDIGDQPPSNKRDHYTAHTIRFLQNNLRFYWF